VCWISFMLAREVGGRMQRREFLRLAGGAAVWPLAAQAAAGPDLDIDGVPLPSDAGMASVPRSATDLQRRWAGVWVGAWNGGLKHILLVERIGEDGTAGIVFAEADNPSTRQKARWRRLEAVASGRSLNVAVSGPPAAAISATPFTATYDMDDDGQLDAVFKSGDRIARAAMRRTDLASLTSRDAVVPWSRGTSELLQTDLREDGSPIRLETVVFKPAGPGPFPLAVFNHGSTGKSPSPELVKQTWVSPEIADFLNKRGWLVAFPQRRGRGKSDGFCDEELGRNGKPKHACDPDALRDADRALADIDAAIAVLRRREDVAPGPVLIGGHSRGGALSIAYAGMHPEQISGVINFVGGWVGERCAGSDLINQTLFERGARYGRPTIWLYGHGDSFYSIAHSRKNFAAFESGGGHGRFLEFDRLRDVGHNVIHYPDLWAGPVGEYLDSTAG
jgi:dienelactone hydrolase